MVSNTSFAGQQLDRNPTRVATGKPADFRDFLQPEWEPIALKAAPQILGRQRPPAFPGVAA